MAKVTEQPSSLPSSQTYPGSLNVLVLKDIDTIALIDLKNLELLSKKLPDVSIIIKTLY